MIFHWRCLIFALIQKQKQPDSGKLVTSTTDCNLYLSELHWIRKINWSWRNQTSTKNYTKQGEIVSLALSDKLLKNCVRVTNKHFSSDTKFPRWVSAIEESVKSRAFTKDFVLMKCHLGLLGKKIAVWAWLTSPLHNQEKILQLINYIQICLQEKNSVFVMYSQ